MSATEQDAKIKNLNEKLAVFNSSAKQVTSTSIPVETHEEEESSSDDDESSGSESEEE